MFLYLSLACWRTRAIFQRCKCCGCVEQAVAYGPADTEFGVVCCYVGTEGLILLGLEQLLGPDRFHQARKVNMVIPPQKVASLLCRLRRSKGRLANG